MTVNQMLWLLSKHPVKQHLDERLLILPLPCSLQLLDDILKDLARSIFRPVDSLKECLGPHDAMDELLWSLTNCADWERSFLDAIDALVALCCALFDGDACGLVATRASLDEWDVKVEAHRVDVVTSFIVVQSVDHYVEVLEESEAEPVLLYAADVVIDLNLWILCANGLLQSATFGHIHVVSSEQELSI